MEDSKPSGTKFTWRRHGHSELIYDAHCSAVGHLSGKSFVLDDIQKTVAQQGKCLTVPDKAISELTKAIRELTT